MATGHYTANGMKMDFAFLANFGVNSSFFYRKARKGRKENVQFVPVCGIVEFYTLVHYNECVFPITLAPSLMPIRFFCDHCRQLLKIGTSKMGSVVNCPRCNKSVIVPPSSVPQAEQLYQMMKKKRAEEQAAPPPPANIIQEPNQPESAWDELGGNVDDDDLNRWIDELWKTAPAQQESCPELYPTLQTNPLADLEIALVTLQRQHKFTVACLYVAPVIALFVGIISGVIVYAFFAPPSLPVQYQADNAAGANMVAGTFYYCNEHGERRADVDAVIIGLPLDRPMTQLLSCTGLAPGSAADNDTVQLIHEMGGMYAQADASGSFTLQYQQGVRYFVVLISAHQQRSGEMKPSVLQELRRYFRNPEMFGENSLMIDEYEWTGGKYSFRHTFEMGE